MKRVPGRYPEFDKKCEEWWAQVKKDAEAAFHARRAKMGWDPLPDWFKDM